MKSLLCRLIQWPRIALYRAISSGEIVNNGAKFHQPVLITGRGRVVLGRCNLGVWPSPFFFSGYIHLKAREPTAEIVIEDGVYINNNTALVAEQTRIRLGRNTLLGTEVTIYDSDFHHIDPELRLSNQRITQPVDIGSNVFIGSRCIVLKGTTVGDDCVIGAGSIVSGKFPARSLIAGVPAKVCKDI